jgi:hypothetical protein
MKIKIKIKVCNRDLGGGISIKVFNVDIYNNNISLKDLNIGLRPRSGL